MINNLNCEASFEAKEDTGRNVALSDYNVFRSLLDRLQHGADEAEFLAKRVVLDMRTDQF
jgi:hypothetical protein